MGTADSIGDARRILVYGVTGSGKTTLAARLGEALRIRWHSVDDLTWEPGWIAVPGAEQRRRIERICEEPEWILDTAYSQWLDVPMARAQLIVALDYPRWFSLQRLVRRTVTRLVDGREICNGNRETVREFFSRDAIILWHFRSFTRKQRRMRQWCEDPEAPPVLRLTSAREAGRLLSGLREDALGH